LEKLDGADEDVIPDNANRKEPSEKIGKKNSKDPSEMIQERNSNAIIPPVDLKSESKSNDGYSNCGVNAMLLMPFLANEVDDKEPKRQAFVAVNYSPKIGGIGTYMFYLSFQYFVNVMHQLTIVFTIIVFIFYMNAFLYQTHIIYEFVYISVCQVDRWNDFVDEDGNKLNIGKLKYQTKHGKFCPSYVHYVPARNVKSALALVVRLFLEHSKVTASSSMAQDSAMLIIKETTNATCFIPVHLERSMLTLHILLLIFYPCCCYLMHILTTMQMLHPHGQAGIFL
jgi:hypothetical protein